MESTTTTSRVALKWGLIYGVIYIAYLTISYIFELWRNDLIGLIALIPLLACIYLGHKEYAKSNEGYISYSQGIGMGALIGAVSGITASIYEMIYTQFIDTNLIQNISNVKVEKMKADGATDQQIEISEKIISFLSQPSLAFIFGVIGFIIGTFILSLIVSAITQKKKPVFM